MRCKNSYNPAKDIMAVEQFGFVDIVKANATGVVDTPLDSEDSRYNGIEDPRSIGARPSDIFEAMQANVAITGFKNPDTDGDD